MFGLAVIVLLVGAFRSKGNVDVIDVSDTDLVIGPEDIRVTFLFEPVSERELEDRMIENGYA